MKLKHLCSALLCVLLLNSVNIPASALSQECTIVIPTNSVTEISDLEFDVSDWTNDSARATNRLDWSISPNNMKRASTAFSLDANETVTFNGTYTPTGSSVDFGLISSDGTFYYINSGSGRIKATVKVPTADKYYLAIRNNSSTTVQVSCTVSY